MKRSIILGMIFFGGLLFCSCDGGPKVIEATNPSNSGTNGGSQSGSTGIFSEGGAALNTEGKSNSMSDVHTVKVNEILPTQKYVYLNVTEDERTFWIATGKQEVQVGGQYFYQGGLLKTNFESKEYDRVFDEIYLVSKIVPLNHGNSNSSKEDEKENVKTKTDKFSLEFNHGEDFVKISELVESPEKFDGKKIKLTGQCAKLNANIMGTNWIHLKDGTKDDYDLVLTSQTAVPVGHIVKMEGTVILNKDFGSGYRYDILVEDAVVIND